MTRFYWSITSNSLSLCGKISIWYTYCIRLNDENGNHWFSFSNLVWSKPLPMKIEWKLFVMYLFPINLIVIVCLLHRNTQHHVFGLQLVLFVWLWKNKSNNWLNYIFSQNYFLVYKPNIAFEIRMPCYVTTQSQNPLHAPLIQMIEIILSLLIGHHRSDSNGFYFPSMLTKIALFFNCFGS